VGEDGAESFSQNSQSVESSLKVSQVVADASHVFLVTVSGVWQTLAYLPCWGTGGPLLCISCMFRVCGMCCIRLVCVKALARVAGVSVFVKYSRLRGILGVRVAWV
jgi:hypothetical protein